MVGENHFLVQRSVFYQLIWVQVVPVGWQAQLVPKSAGKERSAVRPTGTTEEQKQRQKTDRQIMAIQNELSRLAK